MKALALVSGLAALLVFAGPAHAADELARARALLAATPVLDGHNDIPEALRDRRQNRLDGFAFDGLAGDDAAAYHTDLARLKAGGIGGVFWSVYVSAGLAPDEAVRVTLEQIDTARRLIARYPGRMEYVDTADGAARAMKAGRVASFMGAEGGHSIHNSLAVLRQLYALGVRYMTITHSKNNDWADSATDEPMHNGLTPFGRGVIGEMNRLGMLVDLSHVSPKTMADVLDIAQAPVIFSHSSARGVVDHPRNVPDAILARMPANGGVVMVNFVPPFIDAPFRAWAAARSAEEARLKYLFTYSVAEVADGLKSWDAANPAPAVTARAVADHIDRVRRVAGIDHIGIGSDFDGVPYLPVDLARADMMPNLFAELLRRGYTPTDLGKIAQGNVLRALRGAEAVARRLQAAGPPSEMAFTAPTVIPAK